MIEEAKKINEDVQNLLFDELVNMHEYWGENTIIEMLDFCNRNNLKSQKNILIKLLKPDILKA